MEYLNNTDHHILDCSTGEVTVQPLTNEEMAHWRETVERAETLRVEEAAKLARQKRALELVKAKAEEDPHFAALLELLT